MISKACAEANNKFLKQYNPNKAALCIVYVDANDLCGYSIMQLLPIELLDWVNPKKANLEN